jgi:DNA polymerase zeta
MYPYPVELKFEKVYTSLILASKKRYVGYKLEKITDTVPVIEAKGIEIVRRDGCEAVRDIMMKSLEIIFETKDLSQLKEYLQKTWSKIMHGHVNFKDFCIAKEVKLGKYRENRMPAHGIAGLKIA